MTMAKSGVQKLRDLGFDRASYNRRTQCWRPECSQCESLVIAGVPCHETGCPNSPRESVTINRGAITR